MGAAALTTTLILTGCFGGGEEKAVESSGPPEASATVVSEPSAEPSESVPEAPSDVPSEEPSEEDSEPAAVAATKDDLLAMEIPSDCITLGGKHLVDGKLTGDMHETARWISDWEPVPVDADGDGADELIAAFYCDGGGVSWPDWLVLVDSGGGLLDSVVVSDALSLGDKSMIQEWKPGDGSVDFVSRLTAAASVGSLHAANATAREGKLIVTAKESEEAKDEFADAKFSSMGYGPMGLTTPGTTMISNGWGEEVVYSESCVYLEPTQRLKDKGIAFAMEGGADSELWEIFATTDHAKTPSGAHVGMTVEDLKKIYGADLKSGPAEFTHYVDVDGKTMTFQTSGGVVTKMGVHNFPSEYLDEPRGGC